MKNYYKILEVNEKASQEIIKKVFKIQVKKYHPDTAPEDKKSLYEEKIKNLNEAYEVLSDDAKRNLYDIQLKENKENSIYNKEKEEMLTEQIAYLKQQLQKKDQIIEHFLGDLDLSEFYEDQGIEKRNTIDNLDYNGLKNNTNNTTTNNSYSNTQENYIPYNENPQNLYQKIQNFFSPNRPYKNIYDHYIHLLLVFLAKIVIIVVFFVIIFAIITNITGLNMFEIFYNSFS